MGFGGESDLTVYLPLFAGKIVVLWRRKNACWFPENQESEHTNRLKNEADTTVPVVGMRKGLLRLGLT